jgi:hypothetical protein
MLQCRWFGKMDELNLLVGNLDVRPAVPRRSEFVQESNEGAFSRKPDVPTRH